MNESVDLSTTGLPQTSKPAMFSPAGWAVMILVVIIEAFMVYFLAVSFGQETGAGTMGMDGEGPHQRGEIIQLGHIYARVQRGQRPEDQAGFTIKPVLELKHELPQKNVDIIKASQPEIKHKISNIMENMTYKEIITSSHKDEVAKLIKAQLESDFPGFTQAVWIEEYQYE